jgi:hypothetical protein
MSIIPALGKLKQEDWELQASLDSIVSPRLKIGRKKKNEISLLYLSSYTYTYFLYPWGPLSLFNLLTLQFF